MPRFFSSANSVEALKTK